MSLRSVLFMLFITAAMTALLLYYIKLQADVTRTSREIADLEQKLTQMKAENDADYNEINDSINLEEVRDRAIHELGMKYADRKGYRFTVQFDGDGQHRAEFIGPMREKMEEGYNIVIASRFVTEKKPHSMRMLGSRIIAAAIRLSSGASIADPTSGMRMYDRRMIHLFANQINYPPEPDTVSWLVKNGAKVAEVQAVMDERTGGVSYLTPMNAVRYMTRTLISILFIQSFRVKEKLP